MKAIKCELCGSNDLIKQDGFFICQYCKTKYTLEEAKKLIIEGKVDVSGSSVKIDTTKEIENLYQLARRAKENNNSKNAQKYYTEVLTKDPDSWEAMFFSVYYEAMNCKIAEIYDAAISVKNCEKSVFKLINEKITDEDERKKAINEVVINLINISNLLIENTINYESSLVEARRYYNECVNNIVACREICYQAGNYIIEFFGDKLGSDFSVMCWENGIHQHLELMKRLKSNEKDKNLILNYANKIEKYKANSKVKEETLRKYKEIYEISDKDAKIISKMILGLVIFFAITIILFMILK